MCGYMCLPTHHASIQLSQGKGDYGACQRAVRYGLTDLTLLHLAPRRIGRYGESFRVCCGYRRGHFGIDEDSGGQIDTHKLEQHNSIMLKPRRCQLADANRICGLIRFSAHSLNFFVAGSSQTTCIILHQILIFRPGPQSSI